MRNKYICDLCGTEVLEQQYFGTRPAPLTVSVYCASQNPLGHVLKGSAFQYAEAAWSETCEECRRAVASATADALRIRMALKETGNE